MKSYYADARGHLGEVDFGGCPLCEKGLPVTELVSVTVVGFDNTPRLMQVTRATYEKMQEVVYLASLISRQREKARKFRYNRMIYKGAHHGTR